MAALLCIANFPSNTGYAWDYIERIYAQLATHLHRHQVRTYVAYPSMPRPPRALADSPAQGISLDASLTTRSSYDQLLRFVRRENVRCVYWTDRAAVHPAYAALRLAGVRSIIVHDHTSGARDVPRGVRAALKWVAARSRLPCADWVIAVSEYVRRRHLEVGRMPAHKVLRIYNAVEVPLANSPSADARRHFGLPPERPWVVCIGRATPQKGVGHLFRAFDRMLEKWGKRVRPLLVYAGDGPEFDSLKQLRLSLSAKDDIRLLGYRADTDMLLQAADVCAVPSVWQEAFGLSVAEPMARGKPVVASKVGGIPELVTHGASGLLVPPGDEAALAQSLEHLISDLALAKRLGLCAQKRIAQNFGWEKMLRQLLPLFERAMGLSGAKWARTAPSSPSPNPSF